MQKQDIKTVRLIGTRKRTSNSYGRNLPYMSYRVMVSDNTGELVPLEDVATEAELKELSYWSKRSNTMAMTCWGTSQYFEAQISIARWLGIESKGDWSAFCDKANKLVQQL